jgi:DNA topoisomerase-1
MYKLVIVESPSKCKKIQSYLGDGYKCIASYGHFRELNIKKGLKCIDIEHGYEPIFLLSKSKSKQITKLREMIKEANEVILATDDDREGEAIAWHICKTFKLPLTTKRIIFHEITKPALQRAVQNPTVINMKKVQSQLCRQTIDLLLGFSLSPLLWKYISRNSGTKKDNPLSAGRCQTPALKLVYERNNEIEKQEIKEEYNINGNFNVGDKEIEYRLNKTFTKLEEVKTFLSTEQNHSHIFNIKSTRTINKTQPKPYTTSTLQQSSSNELGFSPKRTMSSAQKLYECGYITYMRTDTPKYSEEFITKASTYIDETYGNEYRNSNLDVISLNTSTETQTKLVKKTKKTKKSNKTTKKQDSLQQNAHEAIRPTNILKLPETLQKDKKLTHSEYRLYSLIWRNTLQSLMSLCKMKQLTTHITSNEKYVYVYNISKYIFPGWHILNNDFERKSNELDELFDILSNKDVLDNEITYNKIYSSLSVTNTKQNYTEASLIKQLEKVGIGRPSTYASLIEKIQERGYVLKGDTTGYKKDVINISLNKDKKELVTLRETKQLGVERNKLLLQPIGKDVIELFMKYQKCKELFDYEFTSTMERNLDEIENGNKLRVNICDEYYKEIKSTLEDVSMRENKDNTNKQIVIDEENNEYMYMRARYGPILRPQQGDKRKVYPLKPTISLNFLLENERDWNINNVTKQKDERNIGSYKGHEAIIKKGKYGWFLNYNNNNISLKDITKKNATLREINDLDTKLIHIMIDNHLDSLMTNMDTTNTMTSKIVGTPSMLRFLSPDLSIRKGRYGPYIFYKTSTMTKPKFLNCKKYEGELLSDETEKVIQWIKDTYM